MDAQARWEMEQMRIAVMGAALDVDPMEALMWCVRITAGEVAYSSTKVAELREEDAIVRPVTTTERTLIGDQGASHEEEQAPEELNLWIRIRQNAVERLAKFSKMAIDAGHVERTVRLAEQAGESLVPALQHLLQGLELTAEQEQRAPELLREMLELLEQPPSAGAQRLLHSQA